MFHLVTRHNAHFAHNSINSKQWTYLIIIGEVVRNTADLFLETPTNNSKQDILQRSTPGKWLKNML